MLTYDELRAILNTTKEERTKQDHQEERQESQVKFKKGGTVQREHKNWQGATIVSDLHSRNQWQDRRNG